MFDVIRHFESFQKTQGSHAKPYPTSSSNTKRSSLHPPFRLGRENYNFYNHTEPLSPQQAALDHYKSLDTK